MYDIITKYLDSVLKISVSWKKYLNDAIAKYLK